MALTRKHGELERAFLDALFHNVRAEKASREGLVTKQKQATLNEARRATASAQGDLLQAYLNELNSNSQPSTPSVDEDDPTVDHDIEPAEEYTDAG